MVYGGRSISVRGLMILYSGGPSSELICWRCSKEEDAALANSFWERDRTNSDMVGVESDVLITSFLTNQGELLISRRVFDWNDSIRDLLVFDSRAHQAGAA